MATLLLALQAAYNVSSPSCQAIFAGKAPRPVGTHAHSDERMIETGFPGS
jgi:hypothetical protein